MTTPGTAREQLEAALAMADRYEIGGVAIGEMGHQISFVGLRSILDENTRLQGVVAIARELVTTGMVNRGVDRGLVVVEKADRSDPHYRLCTALDAMARQALEPEKLASVAESGSALHGRATDGGVKLEGA